MKRRSAFGMTGVVLLTALVLASCGTVPFRETETASMEGIEPASLLAQFREVQPERFRTMNSVVFEFLGKQVSALGITEVDQEKNTFTTVAMNPMGLKLFELSGAPDGTTGGFMIDAISRGRKGSAAAVGEDIRRIYFGLVPSPGARVERLHDRIVFRERSGTGTLEYVFAGAGGLLAAKELIEAGETVWKVRYYEYRRIDGKVYPGGIVLDNHRYGYRLIIKVREIMS